MSIKWVYFLIYHIQRNWSVISYIRRKRNAKDGTNGCVKQGERKMWKMVDNEKRKKNKLRERCQSGINIIK